MKKFFAVCAGLVLLGAAGASQADAQGVNIRINRGNHSVEVNTRHGHAHEQQYVIVKRKVWVPDRYETVCEQVWIPPTCEIVEERVWVPGRYVTVTERQVDHRGRVCYVEVRKFVPGHYHTVQRHVDIPGRYETRHRQVLIPGHYEIVEERVLASSTKPAGRGAEVSRSTRR